MGNIVKHNGYAVYGTIGKIRDFRQDFETVSKQEKEETNTRLLCKDFVRTHSNYQSKIDNSSLYALLPVFKAYKPALQMKLDTFVMSHLNRLTKEQRDTLLDDAKVTFNPPRMSVEYTVGKEWYKGKDKARFVHPYIWNEKHEKYHSRTVNPTKEYWNSETANAIHKQALEYFRKIDMFLSSEEEEELKAVNIPNTANGMDILTALYEKDCFKAITYNLLKSISSFMVRNKEGQLVQTRQGFIAESIKLEMYEKPHNFEETVNQVILIYSELLTRPDWHNFIVPDGKGWIQYKTYITPRSKKTVSYYNKIRQQLEKWLYKEFSGKIADISSLSEKMGKSHNETIEYLQEKSYSSFDSVLGEKGINDFMMWFKPQIKTALYEDLKEVITYRLQGYKDKEIAGILDLEIDRIKYINRLVKKAYDRYKVKDIDQNSIVER